MPGTSDADRYAVDRHRKLLESLVHPQACQPGSNGRCRTHAWVHPAQDGPCPQTELRALLDSGLLSDLGRRAADVRVHAMAAALRALAFPAAANVDQMRSLVTACQELVDQLVDPSKPRGGGRIRRIGRQLDQHLERMTIVLDHYVESSKQYRYAIAQAVHDSRDGALDADGPPDSPA